MVCAENTVLIPMRACDREKSDALGTCIAERVSCGNQLVVRETSMGGVEELPVVGKEETEIATKRVEKVVE